MNSRPPFLSDYIALAGRAMYGEEWAQPMAKRLGINGRTAQRIKAAHGMGQPYAISAGLVIDARAALIEHGHYLIDLAETIPKLDD